GGSGTPALQSERHSISRSGRGRRQSIPSTGSVRDRNMADILRGQDEALELLRAALRSGHVGHAYLFHGPSGGGKTRSALYFARALLCDARLPDGSPCETCESCRMALALRHPDLELRV